MRRIIQTTFILLFACIIFPAFAAAGEKRLALVIGVSDYEHLPQLRNAVPDAELIAEKLKGAGFEVDVRRGVMKAEFDPAVRDFARKVASAGPDAVALVYYAGHGIQDDRQVNYLIAKDGI